MSEVIEACYFVILMYLKHAKYVYLRIPRNQCYRIHCEMICSVFFLGGGLSFSVETCEKGFHLFMKAGQFSGLLLKPTYMMPLTYNLYIKSTNICKCILKVIPHENKILLPLL